MSPSHSVRLVFLTTFILVGIGLGQTENATVVGRVSDSTGAAVTGADVELQSVERGTTQTVRTNDTGIYSFASIQPGQYRLTVRKEGFRKLDVLGLVVNVQDRIEENVRLQVGSVAESVTVTGSAPLVNTQDGTVSTVVDRQLAENLPMNGRSFQTLIQLTPGVVLTPSTQDDTGQFSVNGQRASSNYWMVDGVSANFGISPAVGPGNGFGGVLGSFSAQGGTNSLVSVDALQEFRIQTSTFAPEFGRTPGAQISIVTRSGANQFHGSAFDYLRNDIFDASDWFNGNTNNPPLPKAAERQNDFGGTLSGPMLKNRSFFFFSYEGLRLRLPRTALTTVPDLAARQASSSALRPFLEAFPKPNGPEVLDASGQPTGAAAFNSGFSNRSTLDAYSLRIDHRLTGKLNIFGRYDYSPSEIALRQLGGTSAPVNNLAISKITTQTATLGSSWTVSSDLVNDLRLNFSRANGAGQFTLDDFGGATPLNALPLPGSFAPENTRFTFTIFSLAGRQYDIGKSAVNVQRQWNIVDNLSLQHGQHNIKIGVDFRRLSPTSDPFVYGQNAFFSDIPSAESGSLLASLLTSSQGVTALLRNLGLFAQDTWRATSRLTLTYGLRWDLDFVPSVIRGASFPAVTGYDLSDLSNLALLPAGTPAFKTTYGNVAPRVGAAYQLRASRDWTTVVRGGTGIFYDLVDSELAQGIDLNTYPFGATTLAFGGTFPLNAATSAPPPIVAPGNGNGMVSVFDPQLRLPYTLEWNLALEQSFGGQQTISASYIGAAGRRLVQSALVSSPNPTFASAALIGNTATSDYNALQIQFQRRVINGLQALASYTWSHSIDTASAGSVFGNEANALVPGFNSRVNRASSDFDVRHAATAGITYAIPGAWSNIIANAAFRGWSLQNIFQARSAQPVSVFDSEFSDLSNFTAEIRPDLIAGIPIYRYGPQYPGGKAFNNAPDVAGIGCLGPFCPVPADANGVPLRQGTLARNSLTGFPAVQWDLAIHRDFRIWDTARLQFRAEMFNVVNHPNFAAPVADISNSAQFGKSIQMLGQSLGGNVGSGGFDPLYQLGGPRSIQLALKLLF